MHLEEKMTDIAFTTVMVNFFKKIHNLISLLEMDSKHCNSGITKGQKSKKGKKKNKSVHCNEFFVSKTIIERIQTLHEKLTLPSNNNIMNVSV